MKYFTKKLWKNIHKEDAWEQWRSNINAYRRCFEQIKPKLSKKAVAFFGKVSLHDSLILSITFGDYFKKDMNLISNFVGITARKYETGYDYILRYTKVSKCIYDFPSNEPMQSKDIFSFGEWAYDELSLQRNGILCHEILFTSGATLFISFKHFTYKRLKY